MTDPRGPAADKPPRARGAHAAGGGRAATVRSVVWPADLPSVRGLFEEYRRWLADHRDPAPASQDRVQAGLALVDALVRDLPRAYSPPHGDILLWFEHDDVVACGALRQVEPGVGEIRRISVRADYRGGEFGVPFVRALLARARELHLDRVRADTLPTMRGAIEFYEELGFRRVPAFWPHPVADAIFFEREVELRPPATDGPRTSHPSR